LAKGGGFGRRLFRRAAALFGFLFFVRTPASRMTLREKGGDTVSLRLASRRAFIPPFSSRPILKLRHSLQNP
jgi:hypothetical protein